MGPKVAACVALFSLDKHSLVPVDTHVWQVRHTCITHMTCVICMRCDRVGCVLYMNTYWDTHGTSYTTTHCVQCTDCCAV